MSWTHDQATDFEIQMPEGWTTGPHLHLLVQDHPDHQKLPQDLKEWLGAGEDDPSLDREFHWAALRIYTDQQGKWQAAYCWMKRGYLTGHLKDDPGIHMTTPHGDVVINQGPLDFILDQPTRMMIGLLEEPGTSATLALVMCSRGEEVTDIFQQDMISAMDHLSFHSHRRPNWGKVQAAGLGAVALAALLYNILA